MCGEKLILKFKASCRFHGETLEDSDAVKRKERW
jgi:hypothetical protein